MSFTDLIRTPVTRMVMYLDYCGRSFGVAPCNATGEPCYNTWHTCRFKEAYLKTRKPYEFVSAALPKLPWPGPRPYILKIAYRSTEIKDSLTADGRTTVTLANEPDTDIGIDPYVAQRSSVQGTYWKKLIARNPNYKGRDVEFYEGTLGDSPEQYRKTWSGVIDGIDLEGGNVRIEIVDKMKALSSIDIPPKLEIKLVSDLAETALLKSNWTAGKTFRVVGTTAAAWEPGQKVTVKRDPAGKKLNSADVTVKGVTVVGTDTDVTISGKRPSGTFKAGAPVLNYSRGADIEEMTLTTLEGLPAAPGYIRIQDEVIEYGATDGATNRLLQCGRGFGGTTAAGYKADESVKAVRYVPPMDPFDFLVELLTVDCEYTADDINGEDFEYWKAFPGDQPLISAFIAETIKADKLFFEVVTLLDCKAWVDETFKVRIRRNLPNEPGRPYRVLTDAANLTHDNRSSVDLNEKSRFTRTILFWDKDILAKDSDEKGYSRVNIAVDQEAEHENDYGDEVEKKILCRWLREGYLEDDVMEMSVQDLAARATINHRDAQALITVAVDLKDGDLMTGDYVIVHTDELEDVAGNPVFRRMQIVKRDPKGDKVQLKLITLPEERIGFIAGDDVPDYEDATEAEREYGYICDDDGTIDGRAGYIIY